MALPGSDVSAVVGLLDELGAAPADGFMPAAIDGIERLIPADSVWWASCDYGRHANALASSDRRVGPAYEAKQSRWWELYGEHPLLAHRDRTGSERAYRLSDFAGRRALRRLAIYDEFFRPFGVEYSLSIRVAVAPGYAVDVGATRSERDFSRRDRDVLDLLRPAIGAALRSRERAAIAYREAGLTEREAQVMRLAAAGLSNAQIGAALFIASGTVKKHLDNVYGKLGVGNRTQAATWPFSTASSRGSASS